MKIKLIACLSLLIVAKVSSGQNTYLAYNSALKIYNLTSFDEQVQSKRFNDTTFSVFTQSSSQLWRILQPTIAYQWKSKENNFHEIELTDFTLWKDDAITEIKNDSTGSSQVVRGYKQTITSISARYEYIVCFNPTKERKLVPSVGFGISPYFRKNDLSPNTSSAFPAAVIRTGIRTFVTPRLTYFVTPRIFVDLNIPICITDSYILSDIEDSPEIPVDQRKISTFNFTQFPRLFNGRFGVGIKL